VAVAMSLPQRLQHNRPSFQTLFVLQAMCVWGHKVWWPLTVDHQSRIIIQASRMFTQSAKLFFKNEACHFKLIDLTTG
jgi:hypothetical protein